MHEQLVLEFFVSFSRLEYALKKSGNVAGEAGRDASADWDVVEEAFRSMGARELRVLAGILLSAPPHKQVVANDRTVAWSPAAPAGDDAQRLVVYIKRVRNNLFHGGKYLPGGVYLNARNVELVTAANNALATVLEAPDLQDVASVFHGPGEDEPRQGPTKAKRRPKRATAR